MASVERVNLQVRSFIQRENGERGTENGIKIATLTRIDPFDAIT